MQVAVGPLHVELEVGQPLQAVGDGRHARGELAGVGDDGVVAGQPVGVLGHVGLEVDPADLFLTLDQELDVDGERPGRLEPGLGRLQVGEHLALVVGGAAGVEVAVANRRLERRREPGLQRLGRLHVVVAVDQQGRFARRTEPFGVDDGVPLGGDQLGFQPHRRQVVADEVGRSPSVGVVIRLGADAGNPDQVLELLFEVGPMLLEIGVHSIQRHSRPPFRVRILQVPRCGPSCVPDPGSCVKGRVSPANPACREHAPLRPGKSCQYIMLVSTRATALRRAPEVRFPELGMRSCGRFRADERAMAQAGERARTHCCPHPWPARSCFTESTRVVFSIGRLVVTWSTFTK